MSGPNIGSGSRSLRGVFPIATITATYQINGGTAIASGASVTDSVTFTGVAATDVDVSVGHRDAISVNPDLQLTKVAVTGTNTVALTWTNVGQAAITPPASATWTAIVMRPFNE